ncbi:MAG TPA: 2-dehydropantoate 2-reductase [Vicinamibacterales bacterium]|nr:2-dehydropantoate 2-reductase [Vicinamibacterales bacterium]
MSAITLIGPGAIGSTLAAWLSQGARHSVAVAVRTPFDSIVLTTPNGRIEASPRVLTDPAQAAPADWVLITTKAYDSAAAARWFTTSMGPQTRVAVIQNGVEHVERFAPYVDAARIVPVMIDCSATRLSPGQVIQGGPIHIVVPAGPNGAEFVALFDGLNFDVRETSDFVSAAWKKLCLNSAGAVSAALLEPAGIAHHEGVAAIMRAIVRECVAVGRAKGALLGEEIADEIVERTRRGPRDAVNSMLADRRAGRPMEIDARNDVIVRYGRELGIPTPMNALMVAMLEAAEDCRRERREPGA